MWFMIYSLSMNLFDLADLFFLKNKKIILFFVRYFFTKIVNLYSEHLIRLI